MNSVIMSILDLKLGDHLNNIDKKFKIFFDEILEDLDANQDSKIADVFFKVENDKVMTNKVINKMAGKSYDLPF